MGWLLVSRGRLVVVALVVAALVASVGAWALSQLPGSGSSISCEVLEAETAAEAAAAARHCRADVEVLAERTPWETSWELPSGESMVEISVMPVRVAGPAGEWVELDTSLVASSSTDEITVAAPIFPMSLNPGGAAGAGQPLGSLSQNGHSLDVWFPLELPVPLLEGSQAIYDLGEGIRLVVNVNVDGSGFIPVVELVDPAAAELFEDMLDDARVEHGGVSTGMDIEFATSYSEGLTLQGPDEEGAVFLVDAAGETVFFFSSAGMWDSSGEELPIAEGVTEVGLADRTRSPAGGDRIVMMDVEVVGDTIVVTPDAEMLDSSETVWPVYIDPTTSNNNTPHEWIAVRTGGYTSSLWKWGDISPSMPGQGMGNCTQVATCNVVFKQRLAWEFNGLAAFGNMAAADIISAAFRVNGVHSYNCTARKADLIQTWSINGSSNWGNTGPWTDVLGSRTDYHSSSCGNTGWKDYNATDGVKWLANNNASNLTLGLKANDEGNMNGWKRFKHDAKLNITYNRAPNTPTDPRLVVPSVAGCVTGAGRPVIATLTPTLSGVVSDPDIGDSLRAHFAVEKQSSSPYAPWSAYWNSLVSTLYSNNQRAQGVSGTLSDGDVFRWRVRGYDGARYSAYTGWCEFAVDVTAPVAPSVTPVMTGVAAVYEEGRERGGVNLAGKFTLNRGASADVVTFLYGFNDPLTTKSVAVSGSSAVIDFPAAESGPVTLYVKSRDKAGNVSPVTTYSFVVAAPSEDAVWMMDEGSGGTASGAAGFPVVRDLTVVGSQWSWTTGPHDLFDSRDGDHALRFEGGDAFAETAGPVVDTSDSFVVSAHVRLDEAAVSAGDLTVLAQDGVTQSAFRVEYRASCPNMDDGCWAFAMPDTATGAGETVVRSAVAVTGGEWVHLLAEFDAMDGDESQHSMRLWVCTIGTPSAPEVGEPVVASVQRSATPWYAAGAFTVGRGLASGQGAGFWHGDVDNVRVFTGEVVDASKIRRVCQGAEATDFSDGNDALDPTIEGEL